MSLITADSVSSRISRDGSRPELSSARSTSSTRPGMTQLHGRHVDGDLQSIGSRVEFDGTTACLHQHPTTDGDDQLGLFGQRDELHRLDAARGAGDPIAATPRHRPADRMSTSTIGW